MIELSIPLKKRTIPKEITEYAHNIVIRPKEAIPVYKGEGYSKCTIDCRSTDFSNTNIPALINKLKDFDIVSLLTKPADLKYIKNYKIDTVQFDLTDRTFFKNFKQGFLLEMFHNNIYLEINLAPIIRSWEFLNLRRLYEVIDSKKVLFYTLDEQMDIFRTDDEVEAIISLFTKKYRNNKKKFLQHVALKKYSKDGFAEHSDAPLAKKYIFDRINEYF